jgi:pimeloyl-ACP methyl ester carboxylesterase
MTYSQAPNKFVTAANGVEYAYRETGDGSVPFLLFPYFRGNLDSWDPALIDAFAARRRVITFDNTGVGASSGTTPHTVTEMAFDTLAFVEAMGIDEADVLGFSLGGFIAQELALVRPALVRRLVLASSAPQGAAGMHGMAPDVINALGAPETIPNRVLDVFYAPSATSRQAGQQAYGRMFGRVEDRDKATTWQTRLAQYDAICGWGIPNHALLQRVGAIGVPAFITCGERDRVILPHYSYLLAGLIPQAQLKVYPDSAHGFLFQHHAEFAADVDAFLAQAS